MTEVTETLKQRGSKYGTFENNARTTQGIMDVLKAGVMRNENERELLAHEKEALHMIAHKMSRIVCGTGIVKDNWHDIAGYAKLAEDLTQDE